MSFIEMLSSLRRLKCTSIIENGPQSVSFIERLSSLWRLKCTGIIEKGPRSVSFIERFFTLFKMSIISERFYCIITLTGMHTSSELHDSV